MSLERLLPNDEGGGTSAVVDENEAPDRWQDQLTARRPSPSRMSTS